jgi:hypothetical protein
MIRRIQRKLAWVSLLTIWTSLAYALNTGAIGALSSEPRVAHDGLQSTFYVSECRGNPECDSDASDPCALDTDGALYAGSNRWLPAGRSAGCTAPTDPGAATPSEMARHAGRILATITYVAHTYSRVVLYCPNKTLPRQPEAFDLSAVEVRNRYELACT